MRHISAALLLLVLLFALTGCSMAPVNQSTVLTYASPITDNLFAGFNAGNYGTFSRNFDDQMKDTMTKAAFNQIRKEIVSGIGLYQSRTLVGVEHKGQDMIVVYNGVFTEESNIVVTIAFRKSGGTELVSGLHFGNIDKNLVLGYGVN